MIEKVVTRRWYGCKQYRSHSLAWGLESQREMSWLVTWRAYRIKLALCASFTCLSVYVVEAASLYWISHVFSRKDALTIKHSTGENIVIVDRVDERNFRCSLRLFTRQQITNCSRIPLSLYQNAHRPERTFFRNFAAKDRKERTFPRNFVTR